MDKTYTPIYRSLTKPIIAVVAGSGLVVKQSVEAGADLLLSLNAGVYRNLGQGSLASFLPFANANEQTEDLLLHHILPSAASVPVIAGILADDPFHPVEERLQRYRALGIHGITNWPASGFLQVEGKTGKMNSFVRAELDMLVAARKAGFAAYGFVFGPEDARVFAEAGVDALILHLGLTRHMDDVMEKRDQLQVTLGRIDRILEAVRQTGSGNPCLVFGGIVTEPDDLAQMLRHCKIDGFAGGSVFERLPIADILAGTVRRFKSALVRPDAGGRERGMGQILGESPHMLELFQLIKRIAPFDVNVCIEGESGSGKELVAIQLHNLHGRGNQSFVTLNCGAIPDSLLESELFGHEKGAFTGADRRRLGKFELAQHGTLFLDEIADLSPHGQVALLRAIQQREITRIGGEHPISVDVRIIAASNQSLTKLVEQGKFRSDLYHRLSNITLKVPPLRERKEDLPLLIEDILTRLRVQLGRKISGVSQRFMAKLRQHPWPGNVRELQHVISQAALLEDGVILEGKYFLPQPQLSTMPVQASQSWPVASRENRQALARRALQENRGNKSHAAAALVVTRKTLYAWLSVDSQESGTPAG